MNKKLIFHKYFKDVHKKRILMFKIHINLSSLALRQLLVSPKESRLRIGTIRSYSFTTKVDVYTLFNDKFLHQLLVSPKESRLRIGTIRSYSFTANWDAYILF